ncbi:Dps family protein [Balneatrix alpica]|uniref:Dps family protein n=1 Tax=Balneatrix alpica TaxID=75684 RepID=A0ABV5Z6L6_9GAMM|nr:Dps family protein [Balneatrix alpica]
MEAMNIGINEQDRARIAQGLSQLLADTYTLYLQTHNFHWNVTGPMFHALHAMFEQQYTEMAVAVDDIAERIRALGARAPGSYLEFSKLSKIKEQPDVSDATAMLQVLVQSHETLVRTCREVLPLAQEAADESSAGLLADRMALHEKTAWMLRAMLGS